MVLDWGKKAYNIFLDKISGVLNLGFGSRASTGRRLRRDLQKQEN